MNKLLLILIPLILVFPQNIYPANFLSTTPLNIDLNEAMNMDENYSFDVKTAQSEQHNAQLQKDFSITQLGPTLSSTGSKSWYDKNNTFSDTNNHGEGGAFTALSVTATQPLIGIIQNGLKVGQTSATLQANNYKLNAAKINARLEGAKSYILVQQALRTLEAKKSATKSAQELYKEAEILFNTGSIEKTKIDVLQTKAEAAAARLNEISAQKDLHAALVDLGTKIGVKNVDQIYVNLEKISMWEKISPQVPTLEMSLKHALEHRPEVKAAEETLQAAKYNVRQSYFNSIPQVNLFATYSRTTGNYSTLSADTNVNQFIYGVNLNWSIWDGGVQAAAISANINEQSKSSIENEKIASIISQDIENSLNDLKSAIQSLNDAKDAADSYEASFQLATIQYKTGDYSAINLIDTQNKLTSAKVALANVRSDLDLSWMKLQAALGESPRVFK